MSKNPYEEGTQEFDIFEAGVAAERDRLVKILERYHNTFGEGDLKNSSTKMEIRYMYQFATEAKTVK